MRVVASLRVVPDLITQSGRDDVPGVAPSADGPKKPHTGEIVMAPVLIQSETALPSDCSVEGADIIVARPSTRAGRAEKAFRDHRHAIGGEGSSTFLLPQRPARRSPRSWPHPFPWQSPLAASPRAAARPPLTSVCGFLAFGPRAVCAAGCCGQPSKESSCRGRGAGSCLGGRCISPSSPPPWAP